MRVSRMLAVVAIGAGVAALLRTPRGRRIAREITDNAAHWRDIWTDAASDKLSQVKDTLSREVNGLSNDARQRINRILEEGEEAATDLKKKVVKASNHHQGN